MTDWVNQNNTGLATVMYFDPTISTGLQRSSLQAMWTSVAGSLDNNVSWSIRQSGRDLNDQTGALEGSWGEAQSRIGSGTVAGEAVADASQILMRWNTGTVVHGRFLKGRTFLPGGALANVVGGNYPVTAITALQAIQATFLNTNCGFGIWHRPGPTSPGEFHRAVAGTVWNEYAVLRRRRK